MIGRTKQIALTLAIAAVLSMGSVTVLVLANRMPDTAGESRALAGAAALGSDGGASNGPAGANGAVALPGSKSNQPIVADKALAQAAGTELASGVRDMLFRDIYSDGGGSGSGMSPASGVPSGSYVNSVSEFFGGVSNDIGVQIDKKARDELVNKAVEEAKLAAQEEYDAQMQVRLAFEEKYGKQVSAFSDSEIDKNFSNDYFVGRMKELGYYDSKVSSDSQNRRDAIIRAQSRANVAITAKLDYTTKRTLINNTNVVAFDVLPQKHPEGVWVVLNKSRRILTVYNNGVILQKYPVAVGSSIALTPTGQWTFVSKYVNPRWGGGGYSEPIAGGARNNPLGTRWMGISKNGGGRYGVHGNASPFSIGTNASNGCVRMIKADSEELYDIIDLGVPIWIGTTAQLEVWGIYQETKAIEPVLRDYREFLSPEMAELEIAMLRDYGLYEGDDATGADGADSGDSETSSGSSSIIDAFNPGRNPNANLASSSSGSSSTASEPAPAETPASDALSEGATPADGSADGGSGSGGSDSGNGAGGSDASAGAAGSGGEGSNDGTSSGGQSSDGGDSYMIDPITGNRTRRNNNSGDAPADAGNSSSGDSGSGDSGSGNSDSGASNDASVEVHVPNSGGSSTDSGGTAASEGGSSDSGGGGGSSDAGSSGSGSSDAGSSGSGSSGGGGSSDASSSGDAGSGDSDARRRPRETSDSGSSEAE